MIAFRIHENQISQISVHKQLDHSIRVSKDYVKKIFDINISYESIKYIMLANKGKGALTLKTSISSIEQYIRVRDLFNLNYKSSVSALLFLQILTKIINVNFRAQGKISLIYLVIFTIFKKPKMLIYLLPILYQKLNKH